MLFWGAVALHCRPPMSGPRMLRCPCSQPPAVAFSPFNQAFLFCARWPEQHLYYQWSRHREDARKRCRDIHSSRFRLVASTRYREVAKTVNRRPGLPLSRLRDIAHPPRRPGRPKATDWKSSSVVDQAEAGSYQELGSGCRDIATTRWSKVCPTPVRRHRVIAITRCPSVAAMTREWDDATSR